jgi:hypothetical protein
MATRARRVNFGEGRWRRMTLLLLTRHGCGGVGGIFLPVLHSIPPFVYFCPDVNFAEIPDEANQSPR